MYWVEAWLRIEGGGASKARTDLLPESSDVQRLSPSEHDRPIKAATVVLPTK
jgi:hypothetical protein